MRVIVERQSSRRFELRCIHVNPGSMLLKEISFGGS